MRSVVILLELNVKMEWVENKKDFHIRCHQTGIFRHKRM